MKNEELQAKLLQYNKDYLRIINSDIYKVGLFFADCKSLLRNGRVDIVFKKILLVSKKLKIRKISTSHSEKCNKYSEHYNGRVAVYKVVFGNYDVIKEPEYIDDKCDYYIITDQTISRESKWKRIIPSQTFDISSYENTKKNRFYKMNPFIIFPDYEYSIYLDGNIDIYGNISDLIQYVNPKTGIALHNMSNRDCIYDEVEACILLKKGSRDQLIKQICRYERDGFPRHFGLYECPVIVRNNSEICKKIMKDWWNEYEKSSGRDQVSLPYVIWKNGYLFSDVGFIGNDIRNNPYFRQVKHVNEL